MTDQDRNPEPRVDSDPLRRGEAGGGAMTGATGSLTPPESDEPFVPAEQREIADPAHIADATAAEPEPDADDAAVGTGSPVDAPSDASVGGDERAEPERY